MSLNDGVKGQVKIHQGLTQDDHNVGAISILPDGRYLTAFADHNYERISYFRISKHPHDPTSWQKVTTFNHKAPVTYSNLFTVISKSHHKLQPTEQQKTLINFNRSVDYDPNLLTSNDNGKTWQYRGQLLGGDGRPYVRYAQGKEKVHFIVSDQHPRDFDNAIYHGSTDGDNIYSSFNKTIDTDITDNKPAEPNQLTLIHQGKPSAVGWPVDLEVASDGHPYAIYSVQVNGQNRGELPVLDHRFFYAKFNGKNWKTNEIAYAGSSLYEWEQDYTGLAALDPHNPNYIVISTNSDPVTGKALISQSDGKRHWELYGGLTRDDGASWQWTALTENSTSDNIRPIIPSWNNNKRIILWMRGTYASYTDFSTQIVGITQQRQSPTVGVSK